jgi:hypothetical protein
MQAQHRVELDLLTKKDAGLKNLLSMEGLNKTRRAAATKEQAENLELIKKKNKEITDLQIKSAGEREKLLAGGVGMLASGIAGGAEGAKNLVAGAATAIATMIGGPIGEALGPVFSMFAQGAEHTKKMVQGFMDALPDVIGGFIEAIPVFFEALIDMLPVLVEKLAEILPRVLPRFAIAFLAMIPKLTIAFTQALIQGAIAFVKEIIRQISTLGMGEGGWFSGLFAEGGVVPGNSYSGDNMLARVNSGEMILNKNQIGNLFEHLQNPPQREAQTVSVDDRPIVVQIDGREVARATREQIKQGYRLQ